MNKFKKWLKSGTKIRVYLNALIDDHPALMSALFYVWQEATSTHNAEITDLKTQDHDFRNQVQVTLSELENRAEKAERENDGCREQLRDLLVTTALLVEDGNKNRAELAELRDAVAWYFECIEYGSSVFDLDLGHPHYLRALSELEDTQEHAEQQLRGMTGGEK